MEKETTKPEEKQEKQQPKEQAKGGKKGKGAPVVGEDGEVIDKKAQKIFDDTVKNVAKEKTFYNKLLSLFSFYLGNCSAEDKLFDKLVKDTFYLYLNMKNQYIKQKNAEYYDFIHKIVDEIFTEMIEIDYIKNDSKKFIPSSIATADGMYLQSMTLENYDIKKNLIDYIDILNECLKI